MNGGAQIRWSVRALGALLVAVCGLAACSSGGSSGQGKPLDLKSVSAAVRAQARVSVAGEIGHGARSGALAGAYDYPRVLAKLSIPVFTKKRPVRVTYIANGQRSAWIRRAVYGGPNVTDPYAGALLIPRGTKPWLSTGAGDPYVLAIFGRYDPLTVVNVLDFAGVKLFRDGNDTVRGQRTSRYRAKLPPKRATIFHAREVALWINAKHQVVRARMVTDADDVVRYDVRESNTPIRVTPPGREEIANGASASAGTQLTGPYADVASGSAGSVPFIVLRAPATGGSQCWRVESTPAFVPTSSTRTDGAVCAGPPSGSGGDRVVFPIDSGSGNGYELLGAILPPGAKAVLTLMDGSKRPLDRDPSGLALYAGSTEPGAGFLEVTLPDGRRLACGPGPVSAPGDLEGFTAEDLAGQPWSCLAATE